MDPKSYSEIESYLRDGRIPKDRTTKSASNKFANQCKKYTLSEGQLYHWTRSGGWNLVIQMNHSCICCMMIRQKYYWPRMTKDVETYVKSCYQCQRRGKPQTHNEMHGIVAEAPFERIGIDFVGPLPETEEGNRYILVM